MYVGHPHLLMLTLGDPHLLLALTLPTGKACRGITRGLSLQAVPVLQLAQHKQKELEAKSKEGSRLLHALRSLGDGVLLCNVRNSSWQICFCNETFAEITGGHPPEAD